MGDHRADHKDTDRLRRRTHLPRDSQGFIRVQWLENFYEILYACNERGIHIPYTVVFQYRRIYAAYYTDADGYVQKIDKIADLGPEQVIEVLRTLRESSRKHGSQPAAPMGCRAYYVYSKKQDENFPITEASSDLSVEYFDDSSLQHFLTYRGKENNGVLQQFQEPTTTSVSTIRAYWTAHYCQLETRMNVYKTDDPNIPLEQRAVTFEGELYHSKPFPISSKVEGRITDLINRIVGHLTNSLPANVRIQLMMLNFRIGEHGKIWFLYCNCLKLYDQSLESIGYGRDSQGIRPNSAKLVEASIPPQGLSMRASKKRLGIVCPSTDTRLGPFEKYKIKVQDIFIHFLWHGPSEAWAKLGRTVPDIPLENGKDPGIQAHTLRIFLTMDLRPSPLGKPFFWNADMDEKSLREREMYRWTAECKEAHAEVEKVMDKVLLERPDLKAAYSHWEATMVFLVAQELDSLTQENFRQERARPSFLRSELHCSEHALLVYNATMEEVLDDERRRLYRLRQPSHPDSDPPWSRMGVYPSALRRDTARAPSLRVNMKPTGSLSGSQTARELPPTMPARSPEGEGPLSSAGLPLGGRRVLSARGAGGQAAWELTPRRNYDPSAEGRDALFPFRDRAEGGFSVELGRQQRGAAPASRVTRSMLQRATAAAELKRRQPAPAQPRGPLSPGKLKVGPVLPAVIVSDKLVKQLADQLTPRNPLFGKG